MSSQFGGELGDSKESNNASGTTTLLVLLVLVAVIVLAAHWPTLSANALLLDDDQYLVDNRLVQNPSLSSAKQFLTEVLEPSTVRGYYQPLTMISLMLDVAVGGSAGNLKPFHCTNLCLHVANTLLVIVFLFLLFGQVWPAVLVGLLYGVHPVTIESIAWLSQRKTLLAAFFALWSLIFYLRLVKTRAWGYYAAVLATYILSLLSKPTILAMPLLLLLLDFWPLHRLSKKAILEKLPLFAIAAFAAAITFISQSGTSLTKLPHQAGLVRILLIICHNIVLYLRNFVWPTDLSWYYPFPKPFNLSHPTLLFAVIGTCALVAILLTSLYKTRALLAGWLFFFIAIFPTIGVISIHPMIAADRHMYFPMLGFFLPLASALGLLWHSKSLILKLGPLARRTILIGSVVILTSSEFILTRLYLRHWHDSETVYKYMLTSAPDIVILHNNLANVLKDSGKLNEAIEHFNKSLKLKPNSAEVHNNFGNALGKLGKSDEAIAHYRTAISLKPKLPSAHYNLAVELAAQGKIDQAIAEYQRTIELKPDFVDALNGLAIALSEQGKFEQAIEYYKKAIQLKPNLIVAHGRLGLALANLDRTDEAIEHFRIVLKRRPNDIEMHFNLGFLLEKQGKLDEAIAEYRRALEIDPDFTKARQHLDAALAKQKKR